MHSKKTIEKTGVLKHFPRDSFRPGQAEAILEAAKAFDEGKRVVVIEAPTGCHAKGQPILMYDGSTKLVEDVVVGDRLMGPDSLPRDVLALFRGTDTMYAVTPTKGDPFVVNKSHILSLVRTDDGTKQAGKIVDVSVEDWLTWSKTRKHVHKLFRVGIDFPSEPTDPRAFPLRPYVLGYLLGNGCLGGTPSVTVPCGDERHIWPDFGKTVEELKLGVREEDQPGCTAWYFKASARGRTNFLTTALNTLSLYRCGGADKFVPPQYLTASRAQRSLVLAGLLDSDGHFTHGGFDFVSVSHTLARDTAFLARSLGLAAYVSPCQKSDQNGTWGDYFRVSISGNTASVPTKVPRKQAPERRQKKDVLRTGFDIVPAPRTEYYGFNLTGDGRYLMGDFTVTHNSGKSFMGYTLAQEYGPATYITSQNLLLDQYSKDFPDMVLVKGLRNYTCGVTDRPCDVAPCVQYRRRKGMTCYLDKKGKKRDPNEFPGVHCPYVEVIEAAKDAQIVLFNYHSYHYLGHRLLGRRPLAVLDEGHGIEATYMGMCELNLISGDVEGLMLDHTLTLSETVERFDPRPAHTTDPDTEPAPEDDDSPAQTDFTACGPYYEAIRARLDLVEAEILGRSVGQKEMESLTRERGKLEQLVEKLAHLWNLRRRGLLEDRWVHSWSNTNVGEAARLKMKPIFVSEFVAKKLIARNDRVLIMSATILDPDAFLKSIGVPREDAHVIQTGSSFPVENRPVHVFPVADLSWKTAGSDHPKLVKAVRAILEKHKGQRGIIHSHTFKLTELLRRELGHEFPRLIFQSDGDDRASLLDRHARSLDGVLVAPAMHEGIDLKDDLSRFQIILKLPYPDMKDAQIAARMRVDPPWYGWITALKLVQSSGRSVRSADDHADTYILDKGFRNFRQRNYRALPKWFTESIITYHDASKLLGKDEIDEIDVPY
jgi:Rad3-related DNA helicase